jgi:hypothetical protein
MPLYMGRHDIQGITAEQVAQAHLMDLAASSRHGVEFLTYWLDSANNAAFCLVGSIVNLASRICQAADVGRVLVADEVRDLGAAAGFTFSPVGSRALKGFPVEVTLYELQDQAHGSGS